MHIDVLPKDHYDERTNMLLKIIIVFILNSEGILSRRLVEFSLLELVFLS